MRPDRLYEGRRRAERVLRIWESDSWTHDRMAEYRDELLHRMTRTRVSCSCLMCGNPRRHYGQRTRQELIADLEMREQIEEVLADL